MKIQRPVRKYLRLVSTETEIEMEIIEEVIDYESTLRRNLLRSKGSRMRHGEKLSKNLSSFKPSLHLSQTRRRSNLEEDGFLEYEWHHKIFHLR